MTTRKTCSRCGDRGELLKWTLAPCALYPKTVTGALCYKCDEDMNDLILSFFRVRGRRQLMEKYRGH